MEVVTFEVKPFDAITVTAVYEALAHLRSATHAYVIFHIPDDGTEPVTHVIEEARRVGRAHGVGVIIMGDPRDWDTWNELEEARGIEPAPERLDEFISVQLNQDAQDRIARAPLGKRPGSVQGIRQPGTDSHQIIRLYADRRVSRG